MKILKRAVLIGLVAIVACLLARNLIIKYVARKVVRETLGVEMDIASLDVALFKSDIRIEGLVIHNPEGFGKEPMADIPLIHVAYEMGSFFKGKIHCTLVELEIRDVQAVHNAKGDWNIMRLKAFERGKEVEGKEEGKTEAPAPSAKREMQIDKFLLTLGQVTATELDADGTIKNDGQHVFKVGLDKEAFEDLKSPDEIAQLVGWRVVKAAGLNLAMDWIGSTLKSKLTEGLKAAGEGIGAKLKSFFGSLNPFGGDK